MKSLVEPITSMTVVWLVIGLVLPGIIAIIISLIKLDFSLLNPMNWCESVRVLAEFWVLLGPPIFYVVSNGGDEDFD